ncbi:MAG: hypothetical protein JXA42_21835 [Anaerolineales bacterium]|nr:hypothetical protein [Anaerolineales bacterium]
MTEKDEKIEHRHGQPSLVWPILLITAGVLFLLSNLGVLQVDFWNLWKLWPLLLILSGLEIILGRRTLLGNLILLVITLAVVGGVVFMLISAPHLIGASRISTDMVISEPLDGAELAGLQIDFAAGQLDIGQLEDSASIFEGELELATSREPEWQIKRQAGKVEMVLGYPGGNFSSWGKGDSWNVKLSPLAGLNLDINMGAGDAELTLAGLDVRRLVFEAGAGRGLITLPRQGDMVVKITGGVGQLVVEIPEGMAARIQVERGLGGLSMPDRFKSIGDNVYVSGDWESNENRVDLDISVGVGLVTLREI